MPRRSKRSLAASRRWQRERENALHDLTEANDEPLISVSHFDREEPNTAEPHTSSMDDAASRKRKPEDTEDKPYIKKPPNAFMLFSAEQRQNVAAELQTTDAAKVNVGLGQKWKMMSEQEQAPFFDQAHIERRAHEAKYPEWSANDNFGRKSKRSKDNKSPVPPSHHFVFPVMTSPHATATMSVPNLSSQDLSSQDLIGQDLIGQDLISQDLISQELISQDQSSQDLISQDLISQDLISQDLISQDLISQDLISQDLISQDLISQDLISQDLISQDLSSQAYHSQNNQPLTSSIDYHHQRSPLPDHPPEAFLNLACENQAPIKVLPIETFTIPVPTFQDLSNQAPPCNHYEAFLNMAPEDLSSDFWTSQ